MFTDTNKGKNMPLLFFDYGEVYRLLHQPEQVRIYASIRDEPLDDGAIFRITCAEDRTYLLIRSGRLFSVAKLLERGHSHSFWLWLEDGNVVVGKPIRYRRYRGTGGPASEGPEGSIMELPMVQKIERVF